MSPRATAALFAAACALGALVFFELRGAPGDATARGPRIFPDVEAADVVEITTPLAGGGTATARRSGDGWRLAEPIDFPADRGALDAMAASLAGLERVRTIDEPAAPDVYGLGAAARVVRFATAEAAHALALGRGAPTGGAIYASTRDGDDGAAPIALVAGSAVRAFDRTLDELRDGRPLAFDPDAVERIALAWRDGGARASVALARAGDGFRIVEPLDVEADPDAVARVVDALRSLRARGFVDAPVPEASTGLGAPAYEVTLSIGGELRTLAIGARVPDPERPGEPALRYARGPEAALYVVADARVAALPHDVFTLRYKRLSRFAPDDADAVELAWDGGPPVRVERPALVRALSALDAIGVAADAVGEAERAGLGLDPPSVRARVLAADIVLADVAFGRATRGGRRLAAVPGRSEVFEVPGEISDLLDVPR